MPKDPKRNIQRYQIQGGNLNEFEFQKSQSEMAEESELPLPVETDNPNVSRAKRVAEVTTKAHRKVEKRKKSGHAKAEGQRKASGKKSAKKAAKKSKKKTAKPAVTNKRASVKSRRHKVATSR
jgi:hypothetical protein